MVDLDNPAGRLYRLLAEIKKTPKPQQTQVQHVLTRAFEVPKGDQAELLRCLASALELPAQIRSAVSRLPFDGTSLVGTLETIESAFLKLQITMRVDRWTPLLRDDAMRELVICSDMLHQHVSEGIADEGRLSALQNDVRDLIQDVQQADDLSADLRVFLLDHLHEIQRALDLYRVVGLDALRRALERSIGGIVTKPEMRETEKDNPLFKKFGTILAGLGLLFATGNQGTQLVATWFPDALPAASSIDPATQTSDDDSVVDAELVESEPPQEEAVSTGGANP